MSSLRLLFSDSNDPVFIIHSIYTLGYIPHNTKML